LARTESELFARLTAARERYELAKTKAQQLNNLRTEMTLSHPDGRAAALQAARIEREAIETYSKALREFGDFILRHSGGRANPER